MKNRKQYEKAATTADSVVNITMADAFKLPNMLGAIAPLELSANGWYSCTVGTTKTLYVLTD